MLLVTAYPMGRAVYLSLFSYRLTDPAGREYIGLRNYSTILTDSLWWSDVVDHGRHHPHHCRCRVGDRIRNRDGDAPDRSDAA